MIRLPLAGLLLGISVTAQATDLPLRTTSPDFYAPTPPVFSWTGPYVGLDVGAAAGGDFFAKTLDPLPRAEFKTSLGGFTVGGTLGYNYQLTPGRGFVIGLEADGGYADLHNRTSLALPGTGFSAGGGLDTDSFIVSVRGRAGYAFGPVLAYATGGWAVSDVGFSGRVSVPAVGLGPLGRFPGYAGSYAKSMPIDGYTVGAGLEYAVTPSVSLKVEYRYADLDRTVNRKVEGVKVHLDGGLDVHQFKIGVNYRFSGFPVGSGSLGL